MTAGTLKMRLADWYHAVANARLVRWISGMGKHHNLTVFRVNSQVGIFISSNSHFGDFTRFWVVEESADRLG
jgi:hypothetical protein